MTTAKDKPEAKKDDANGDGRVTHAERLDGIDKRLDRIEEALKTGDPHAFALLKD